MHRKLMISILRYGLSLVFLLFLGLAAFIYWALGTELPPFSQLPVEAMDLGQVVPPSDKLKIVSYNIGHGQGVKEQAWDYRDKATTEKQLTMVADAMKNMDADIFLLQEVDLDSKRTFHINQIEFIKQKTGHPFHACATVWEKNYVPFPYWPIAHHLGYVRAANCVLSRYPLDNHERILFAKPESNPFWYNWGYLDRGIQRVDALVGEKKLSLLNVHLEAWETKAREEQIRITKEYIDDIKNPVVLGGDFNTVLPDAPKKSDFADDPGVDYANEQTFSWFFANAKDLRRPELESEENNPFELFTFPSNQPDRRLDHIYLLGDGIDFTSFKVVPEAGLASDHLPVMAEIEI